MFARDLALLPGTGRPEEPGVEDQEEEEEEEAEEEEEQALGSSGSKPATEGKVLPTSLLIASITSRGTVPSALASSPSPSPIAGEERGKADDSSAG